MPMIKFYKLLVVLLLFSNYSFSQNFLNTSGKSIINEKGDTIILRGMGLGGWMVQEGYMMAPGGFSSTQYQIKDKIRELIGDEETQKFYNNWLKKIDFLSLENNTITLSVPTKFLRDWIVNHYADKIKSQCKKSNSNIEVLKIVVKPIGGRIVPGTARIVKEWQSTNGLVADGIVGPKTLGKLLG